MRAVFDHGQRLCEVNNYYPFGGLQNDSEIKSKQSHKYNGKELDRTHGLDVYDYAARQYDAAICQFTSIDPLCEDYYHISPYAYCAGNPVRYTDPTGMLIQVDGDEKYREWVLETLQKLTNDVLVMNKKGYISIGKGGANSDQDLSCGTGLLREVIGSKHTAFVKKGENGEKAILMGGRPDPAFGGRRMIYDNENDRYNGKGTDVEISFRRGELKGLLVSYNEDDKTTDKDVCPEYVTAAHEFIHGIHDLKGERFRDESVRYYYMNTVGKIIPGQASREELRTVGIIDNYRYSENKIRKEHGLRLRRKY